MKKSGWWDENKRASSLFILMRPDVSMQIQSISTELAGWTHLLRSQGQVNEFKIAYCVKISSRVQKSEWNRLDWWCLSNTRSRGNWAKNSRRNDWAASEASTNERSNCMFFAKRISFCAKKGRGLLFSNKTHICYNYKCNSNCRSRSEWEGVGILKWILIAEKYNDK